MTTTQTARKRAMDASPPNSQPKPRRHRKRISDLPRLRRLAADQIDRLIAFLDSTDPYVQEELEDEPVESNYAGFDQVIAAQDEAEGDHGCDDREDVSEDEGSDMHEGRELDEADSEPSLGWTIDGFFGGVTEGGPDREDDGSYITDVARQRYRPYDRWETIRDGMHVDSERGFGAGSRRIRNLSGRQRGLVLPRIADGSGVSVSA